MARIRSIKPEFWTSEQVMECSTTARLLFIGIWNFCDDAGNHVASPRTIKANVLPADDIDSSTVQGLLDELYENGLIDFYIVENKRYLHVTGWHHQRIDKPTYKHPEYRQGENDEKSIDARRTLSEPSTTEWSGEERSGEGIGEEEAALSPEERPATLPNESPPPSEPENPQPIPDEAPTRNTQIAVLLRRNGADSRTHPGSKGIAELTTLQATDAQVLTALETAKQRRKDQGSIQPVTAAYLVPIVSELQNPPPEKPAQSPQDKWWTSNAGIDRKARELGMYARGNEDYASFKDRIFDEIKRRSAEQGATA